MKKQKLFIVIKWGALLGAGLSLVKLLTHLTTPIDYPFAPIADLLMVALFIFTIYMAIREIRDKVQEGIIRFAPAFGYGIIVVLTAYIIMVGYLLVHYNYIETDGVDKNNQRNINIAYQKLQKDTITQAERIHYYCQVDTIIHREFNNSPIDSTCKNDVSKALDMVLASFEKQLLEKKHISNDVDSRLDSFSNRSLELLYRCIEITILNTPDSNSCLNYLPIIINNSESQLDSINPIHERFEQLKQRIPQSNSTVVAAFAYSFSILLYGLLLNIFVALFLYRKEKMTCSTPNESQNTDKQETT